MSSKSSEGKWVDVNSFTYHIPLITEQLDADFDSIGEIGVAVNELKANMNILNSVVAELKTLVAQLSKPKV